MLRKSLPFSKIQGALSLHTDLHFSASQKIFDMTMENFPAHDPRLGWSIFTATTRGFLSNILVSCLTALAYGRSSNVKDRYIND